MSSYQPLPVCTAYSPSVREGDSYLQQLLKDAIVEAGLEAVQNAKDTLNNMATAGTEASAEAGAVVREKVVEAARGVIRVGADATVAVGTSVHQTITPAVVDIAQVGVNAGAAVGDAVLTATFGVAKTLLHMTKPKDWGKHREPPIRKEEIMEDPEELDDYVLVENQDSEFLEVEKEDFIQIHNKKVQ